ncbi:hypothetical protein C8J55DRAFT_489898 [Lentinula edodes]|uniref:Uncharacterized protein n=1 Tax=Lentinula lateritia TaxID=40482 RepID=A0A9W9DM11_9AGAR|nr:hypothetical protein C8J55DRAFT_489898 [Lentinula edodes]
MYSGMMLMGSLTPGLAGLDVDDWVSLGTSEVEEVLVEEDAREKEKIKQLAKRGKKEKAAGRRMKRRRESQLGQVDVGDSTSSPPYGLEKRDPEAGEAVDSTLSPPCDPEAGEAGEEVEVEEVEAVDLQVHQGGGGGGLHLASPLHNPPHDPEAEFFHGCSDYFLRCVDEVGGGGGGGWWRRWRRVVEAVEAVEMVVKAVEVVVEAVEVVVEAVKAVVEVVEVIKPSPRYFKISASY